MLLSAALALAGCSGSNNLGQWAGPAAPITSDVGTWAYDDQPAKMLISAHYQIHTTIEDDETIQQLPQLMEGALTRYHEFTPGLPLTGRPMDCYIFRTRTEWNDFTQRRTGQDSAIYMQIRSGGYTVNDLFVSYYIGRASTYSVAAHEGWHQYCGRHFKGRLPPFLEEGISCMFESITWQGKLPRWNLSINPYRAQTLRKAIDAEALWPLDKLIATHAGDIVGERMEKIDAFYAQSWAFARFLWEADNARYRPAFQRWMTETANGTVHDATHSHNRASYPWNRKAVQPMMEYYLDMPLPEIDRAFNAYMHHIAFEELPSQRGV